MKSVKQAAVAELRAEYSRSDFGALTRGKYVQRLRVRSNVVVIDPRVAAFFPNPETVNAALLSLAAIAKRAPRPAVRGAGAHRKRSSG